MALEGSIRRLFLFYTEDLSYAKEACLAAIEHVSFLKQLNPDFELVGVLKYTTNTSSAANFFDSVVVEEAIRLRADSVLGCDSKVCHLSAKNVPALAFARSRACSHMSA